MGSLLRTLFAKKKVEPSYPILPSVSDDGETNVAGIYAVGELAGTPLVKLGLNDGHELLQRIGPALAATQRDDESLYDVVIVGSGSSGFAATIAAKDLGLRAVTIEAATFANTFVTMMKGKWLFAEPESVPVESRVWFEECTKETLLEKWRAMWADEGVDIREHERVEHISGQLDDFTVKTTAESYRCRRVLLCLGKAGNPRTLGVPGEREHGDRIHHRLLDAADFVGQDILIVGAGDVACEAAIALATPPSAPSGGDAGPDAGDAPNTVTLSAIDEEFTYPKKRNIDAVRALEAKGHLRVLLGSSVSELADGHAVIVRSDGEREKLPFDSCFEMIGAELPIKFLRETGIRLNVDWTVGKWVVLALVGVAVYSLYALKSYGKGAVAWPFESLISPASYKHALRSIFDVAFAPFAWLFQKSALADIRADKGFQQGYLYSLLYTVVMLVFGYMAMIRWRAKAKDKRYQTYRYITLLSFQVGFFLLVNIIGVQYLSTQYVWRGWGLYQPFPLYFNTYFWWSASDPTWIKVLFIGGGLAGMLVGIPLLSWRHGKRFCTWICGCGGLAETLGDRWRHKAPKGERSRAWEFQAALIMVAAFLIGVVVVTAYHTSGNNPWWKTYNYVVDFWLVAVIPVTLYPFFGGKVWCRYWCPLAAFNQLLSRLYGRLKIVSNDKCITCTECSKYCQVGVDVMAFAKNQQPFDNSNTACIHCGICIDVCPVDVLSFETSKGSAKKLISQGRSSGRSER